MSSISSWQVSKYVAFVKTPSWLLWHPAMTTSNNDQSASTQLHTGFSWKGLAAEICVKGVIYMVCTCLVATVTTRDADGLIF